MKIILNNKSRLCYIRRVVDKIWLYIDGHYVIIGHLQDNILFDATIYKLLFTEEIEIYRPATINRIKWDKDWLNWKTYDTDLDWRIKIREILKILKRKNIYFEKIDGI